MKTKIRCTQPIQTKGKNDTSCMQAFYIGILNKFYDIRIQRPNLNKMKTFPFLTILSIQTEEDEIFLSDYIETRCEDISQLENKENDPFHSYDRKISKHIINETLMFLLDAIEMKNYWFHSSDGKKQINNNVVYIHDYLTSSEMIDRGADINGFICDAFNSEDDVLFERNHSLIQNLVGL